MKKWFTIFAIILLGILVYALSFFDTFSGNQKDKGEKTKVSDRIELTFWRNGGNVAENKAYGELVALLKRLTPIFW
jgi:fructooligosaccharide transport system substrate-binding protein